MAANPRKILVVEDSPTMRGMYELVLGTLADTELRFAQNGIEGLDRAAQEPDVDLLIVDINMPQMDGLEFLRRVRTELGQTAPAIVSSTESEDHDRAAAMAAGADAYLCKPWRPEHLLSTIRQVYPPAADE